MKIGDKSMKANLLIEIDIELLAKAKRLGLSNLDLENFVKDGIENKRKEAEEQFKKEMKEAAPYLNNMPRFSLCECSCKEKSDELIDTNKKES